MVDCEHRLNDYELGHNRTAKNLTLVELQPWSTLVGLIRKLISS